MKRTLKFIWMGATTLSFLVMLALTSPAMAEDAQIADEPQTFTEEQLTQMLAPIALYPDELIAQVLLASTYPLEIVMADRWVQQNKDLRGNELAAALERQNWDPSVKSLVNFPTVLGMLSQKLELTTKLGDAFLEQKDEVMDTVQELRRRAADTGNLKSTREQKVVVEVDAITIEPADSRVVYVPTYDPYVVYGPWWYPAYPPYYFYDRPYPGVVFSFGVGVTLGLPWGYAWGGWDWYNNSIYININRNVRYNSYINRPRYIQHYERRGQPIRNGQVQWQHEPAHRRGVAYRDNATTREFSRLPSRPVGTRQETTRQKTKTLSTPNRPGQTTRSSKEGINRGSKATVVPSGASMQKTRKDNNSSYSRTKPFKAPVEKSDTVNEITVPQPRTSTERSYQNTGGNTGQPTRMPGSESRRGAAPDSGGDNAPPSGKRGDNNHR